MRTEGDLQHWLNGLTEGRAACVFSDDVEDALAVLQQSASSGDARVVSLTWEDVPSLGNELNLLVAALSLATPGFFPALYGLEQRGELDKWSKARVESEAHAITRAVPGVDGFACREILGACYRGETPSLARLSRGEQIRQFGLAIAPTHLFVFIAVLNAPTTGEALRSLSQGAEWLAVNVRGRVVLALPEQLVGRSELDHVSYGACLLRSSVPIPVEEAVGPKSPCHASAHGETPRQYDSTVPPEPVIAVSPIKGRPAKNSDAEQALYSEITADQELARLFSFNQSVRTVLGQMPTVDVLWEAGRLVIEVDGIDHRRPKKFASDRARDYELWLSGYSVVRFTDSSVLERTPWVLERIRQAVRHLRRSEKP